MSAPLPSPEEQAVIDRFEAAEPAPESFDDVEQVMRAIWDAADGYMSGVPWERARENPFKEAKVFRQAVAAIAAMRGES